MGEAADDLVEGACCSHCGYVYFQAEHGYPVLCDDCYDEATEGERAGLSRAIHDEIW